jgi:hypothetical protein
MTVGPRQKSGSSSRRGSSLTWLASMTFYTFFNVGKKTFFVCLFDCCEAVVSPSVFLNVIMCGEPGKAVHSPQLHSKQLSNSYWISALASSLLLRAPSKKRVFQSFFLLLLLFIRIFSDTRIYRLLKKRGVSELSSTSTRERPGPSPRHGSLPRASLSRSANPLARSMQSYAPDTWFAIGVTSLSHPRVSVSIVGLAPLPPSSASCNTIRQSAGGRDQDGQRGKESPGKQGSHALQLGESEYESNDAKDR